jgi:hypothetical protein
MYIKILEKTNLLCVGLRVQGLVCEGNAHTPAKALGAYRTLLAPAFGFRV